MLEIYLNEIIAGVAILVLIVIYFMIKKTQQEHRVVQEEKESIKEEKTPKALIKLNRVKRDIPLHSKITKEDFKLIIESKNRSSAGLSVPAKGLFLTKIKY